MVEGTGKIESIEVVDDMLRIGGWAATRGAGVVDGVRVACAGQDLHDVESELRLPSADIAVARPELDEAYHCRFRIRARLDAETAARARSSVITCTPLIGGQEGPIFVQLIEPAIPFPSEEDLKCVGGGILGYCNEFLGYLIQFAGLKPDSHVLDVGCGVGRMAIMLAHYLGPIARYEGFDIIEHMIRWADREITTRLPHFRFDHVDVYNKAYNPSGTLAASGFRFPYADESFDVIFLSSVFTHMLADEQRHYLDEIHRVLRPGGRCLATYFLVNQESRPKVDAGGSLFGKVHPLEHGYTADPQAPEWAVIYDESVVSEWIAERGFTVDGRYYGWWCGRGRSTNGQDMLLLQKQAEGHPAHQSALRIQGGGPGRGLAGLFQGFRSGRRKASA
jgi:ubiquinone/menaquinone biosynthesis C-methylase UbiE